MEDILKKGFKNEAFINYYLQESNEKMKEHINLIELYPEEVLDGFIKSIDLKFCSNLFISKLLNNKLEYNLRKIDLNNILKQKFVEFYQKFFERFKKQEDFLYIRRWIIDDNINVKVLEACLNRVITVLINEAKNEKEDNIGIYPNLLLFFSRLFSKCSLKLKDFKLDNLEKNYPSSKLIEIYFMILYRKKRGVPIYPVEKSFNEHLREYIKQNAGKTALGLWYKLVLQNDGEKSNYLINELEKNEKEYTIINKDYVGYPHQVHERLLLYNYLLDDGWFGNKSINSLNYYKNSQKSCSNNELMKLTFAEGMKINNNISECQKCFKIILGINGKINDKNWQINNKFNEEFSIFCSLLTFYKEQFDKINEIILFFNQFYPKGRSDEVKYLNSSKKLLNDVTLEKFEDSFYKINNIKEYLEEVNKFKTLKSSIFFMEIYDSSKDEYNESQEKEHFDYTLKQFNTLEKLRYIDLRQFDNNNEGYLDILIKAVKKNKSRLNDELKLIKEYFEYNDKKDEKDKFDVERIKIELEELIPDEDEEEASIIIDKNLLIFEDKFNECYNYYLKEKKDETEENEGYYEKYINYFKDLFGNKEILDNLYSKDFIKFIIKKINILYYSGIINISVVLKKNIINELQLIKDFIEILNVYRNKLYDSIGEELKRIFPILYENLSKKGQNIFKGLQELFSEIVENNKTKKKYFSLCFINILIEEIETGRIKDDKNNILEYIFKNDYLIYNCTPLLDLYFKDSFFSFLIINNTINNNSIIYIKDTSLSILDEACSKSKILREQLLYYFETNINKILEEKYPKEEFIKKGMIKEYIKKIRTYFGLKKPNDNQNINELYFIAFLKVFFTKYINVIVNKNNLRDNYYDNFITDNKDSFTLTKPLSYFILKLYLDTEGNFLDFFKLNKIEFPKEVIDKMNIKKKEYGFDYLILPFNENDIKQYNEISSKILRSIKNTKLNNDIDAVDDINNNSIDVLYCLISNLFLSKLSSEEYIREEEYNILKNWLNQKLEKKSFKALNEHSKKILNIMIKMKEEKRIKIEDNKDLMNIIFALRFVLNSLSKGGRDNFYLNLLINTSDEISKRHEIFDYYFLSCESESEKDKIIKKTIGFKFVKYILLSHLIFAYLLGNIELEKISKITNIKIEDNKIVKVLSEQMKEIQNIFRYKGIKNKYAIIYMNIIFEKIKNNRNIKKAEDESKLYNEKLLKINSEQIQSYFTYYKEKSDDIDFKKIIFEEDFEYESKKLEIGSSYIYFTTPNLCDIDDFKFQFQCQESNSQIIGYILNNKMDEIINKMNCLPIINKIVNTIFNENNLMITKIKAMDERAILDKELIDKFNEMIPDIKNYFNVDFPKINDGTKIFELTNTKDNNIYNIYQNMNETIETYNILLKNYAKLEEINIGIKDIQDFSDLDIFIKKKESKNYAFERLLELIRIYSKRNRYIEDKLNVYDGDKIIYDFNYIEKTLVEEFLHKKKLIINSKPNFIFLNEIFTGERRNLIFELKEKLKPKENENDKNEKLIDEILDKEDNIKREIFTNIQYILIYIYYSYIKNNKYKKVNPSLKEICEKIKENNYDKINEILFNDSINISDIIYLYENIEEKIFDLIKNEKISKDKRLENLKNEKKEEIKEYFKNNKELSLDKYTILEAIKKYIIRYCYYDHQKEDEILFNFKFKEIFEKKDIWDKNILNVIKYKDEINILTKFNDNNNDNLEQYFLYLLFIGKDDEEEDEDKKEENQQNVEKEGEEEEEDKKSKNSDNSNKSDDEKDKSSDDDKDKDDDDE